MQKNRNVIIKSRIWDREVSRAVIDSTAMVNEAISRHALSHVAAAALGRAMTATVYLCSWLKEEQSALSVTLNGDGAGGKICVSGDGALNMRGFVQNPHVELAPRRDGKLDVGGFVGKNGTLSVIRDDGEGLPFSGMSQLISGEIAQDFSAYFLTSEQRPTAIALGVKIAKDGSCLGSGGVFLQPLPFAKEENIDRAAREIEKYSSLSTLIAESGISPILEAFGAKELQEREFSYRCRCSRTRAEDAVLALGKQEAYDAVRELGKISVHCDYCNTDYLIDERRLDELFEGGERR